MTCKQFFTFEYESITTIRFMTDDFAEAKSNYARLGASEPIATKPFHLRMSNLPI